MCLLGCVGLVLICLFVCYVCVYFILGVWVTDCLFCWFLFTVVICLGF